MKHLGWDGELAVGWFVWCRVEVGEAKAAAVEKSCSDLRLRGSSWMSVGCTKNQR